MLKQVKFADEFTKSDLLYEPEEAIEKKCDALVGVMTMQERMDLLHGWSNPQGVGQLANCGYNPGVPRLGVPEIRMYDGPGGPTCVVETTGFPNPMILGNTWDEELSYQYGKAVGAENAMISGNRQLGSQLDIKRCPQFVRNTKSEDPLVCGKLGAAETKGIQESGVVATLKHFAAANVFALGEPANIVVDEQTLHEMYLKPFEEAVQKGKGGSVMAAYNVVNGEHCTANTYLLKDVLRGMWNFKGEVMADWGANHQMTIQRGLDIEMPRDAFCDNHRILRGIEKGDLTWEDVNQAAKHVLYAMGTAGLLGMTCWDEEGSPMEEHGRKEPIRMKWRYEEEKERVFAESSKVAEKILEEGIVLCKNEGHTLPLTQEDIQRETGIAFIGINAKYPICGELSERAFGRLCRMKSPKERMEELTGRRIPTEVAIDFVGEVIPEEYLYQDPKEEARGLVRTYGIAREDVELAAPQLFEGGAGAEFFGFTGVLDEYGELVNNNVQDSWEAAETYGTAPERALGEFASVDPKLDFHCGTGEKGNPKTDYRNGPNGTAISQPMMRFTWRGYLKAPESGEYQLSLQEIGGPAAFKICIDGKWQIISDLIMREGAHWPWESAINTPEGMGIDPQYVTLEAGKSYPILVYAAHMDPHKDLQLRLAWITPSMKRDNYEKALALAAKSSKVVLFLNTMRETAEIFEKLSGWHDLRLPQEQVQLVKDISQAVRSHGGKVAAVLQSSTMHAIGEWEKDVDALLATYMTGQEGAGPLCRILLGEVNPSGKLAHTWPKRNEDTVISDTKEHFQRRYGSVRTDGRKTIYYDEGIFFGYRWYHKEKVTPQFAFGHGLSYTSFAYSDLNLSQDSAGLHVELTVTNTGDRAGDEVVQIYLGPAEVPPFIQMAQRQLAAFRRVRNLKPGESREVSLLIEPKELCYWNPALSLKERPDGTKDKWMTATGSRKVYVGASVEDIRLEGAAVIEELQ